MSASKCVIVLAPNGRRQTVKVTPNTTILQILEEVCMKQGFQPEEYDIKHHNHVLDTTSIMRFSGLPNNAQLEMAKIRKTREESSIMLGLQLESGARVTGTFFPTESVWDVIRKLCPEEADPDSNPVVIYMRREMCGVEDLQATTLRSLGLLGGRAMLRFVHRTAEELHHQAHVSGPLPQRSVVTVVTEDKPRDSVIVKSDAPPEHPVEEFHLKNEENCKQDVVQTSVESMEVASSDMSMESLSDISEPSGTAEEQPEEPLILLGERNAIVFSLVMAQAVPYEDLPDDFFDLTVDDIRSLFRDLKRQRADIEDNPLTTRALRELDESKRVLNQLSQYRRAVLRIQFPDQIVLQGTFTPLETISTVIEFVRGYLEEPSTLFHLYTTPPKAVLSPQARLVDAGCVPCAVVHFGSEEAGAGGRYLRENLLSQLTSPAAAAIAACQSRGLVPTPRPSSTHARHSSWDVSQGAVASTSRAAPPHPTLESEEGPSNKLPKWFKPGK